jgi:UDP-galactopyranose mutase
MHRSHNNETHGSGYGEQQNHERTLICFSHLRWDFVFQRPQHLMSRFAQEARVLYWEEPQYVTGLTQPRLAVRTCEDSGVVVVTPELQAGMTSDGESKALRSLLDELLGGTGSSLIRWYYTPMMLPFSEHVVAECVVYDCMDELANFKNAPPQLLALEQRLLDQADIVFTGGHSLYEAKRDRHANIHPFPSSVDVAHFAAARSAGNEPADQAALPRPRFGFYGVVDERMDLNLLDTLAAARPDWSIVIVGPVVKISEDELPRRANLHYLGGRDYAALPDYLRGWDVALMPFAINESTRFISPTKTPEYLAAGRPVCRHRSRMSCVITANWKRCILPTRRRHSCKPAMRPSLCRGRRALGALPLTWRWRTCRGTAPRHRWRS